MLHIRFNMFVAVVIIGVGAIASVATAKPAAQQEHCDYDRTNPSVDHARAFFSQLEYQCAHSELQDFLLTDSIELDLQVQASAYRLLSAVHYLIGYDEDERADLIRGRVIDAGKAAFKAQPDWAGEFEIVDQEYLGWMQEARQAALGELEQERLAQQQVEEARQDSVALATIQIADSLVPSASSQREQDAVPEPTRLPTSMDDHRFDNQSTHLSRKTVTGLGVLGGLAATWLSQKQADKTYDEYMASVTPSDIDKHWSSYENKVRLRNILGGVTVGLAVLEVIWFVTTPERPASDHGASQAKPSGTAVGLGFDGRTLFVTYGF